MSYREDIITVDEVELIPIPDHPGFYADVENGRVFNTYTENWLGEGSTGAKRTGYIYVGMKNKDGNISSMGLHSAIMSAYMGVPKEWWINKGLCINHISGDKTDNSYFNLQLVTHKDQFKDPLTKERLKQRTNKRMSKATKDTLIAAWEDLDEPVRSEFVNEWSDKLDIHWRTLDNYVKDNLLN